MRGIYLHILTVLVLLAPAFVAPGFSTPDKIGDYDGASLWTMASDTCTCPEDDPDADTPTLMFSATLPGKSVNIPGVGQSSYGGNLMGSVTGTAATCNNECKEKGNTTIGGDFFVKVGKKQTTTTITGMYDHTIERCKACDDDTCEYFCEGEVCETKKGSGMLEVSGSWDYGPTFTLGGKKMGADFTCSLQLTVSGSGSMSFEKTAAGTDPKDCEACEACDTIELNAPVTGKVEASCMGKVRYKSWNKMVGCDKCINASLTVTPSIKVSQGDGCESEENCLGIAGDLSAGIKFSKSLQIFGYWEVSYSCGADIVAGAKADTCEGGSTSGPEIKNAACTASLERNTNKKKKDE